MIPRRVIVIGAGGIGSHFIPVAAQLMAFSGAKNADLTVIDGDRYEEKNQARQLFAMQHIDKNKAAALCDVIHPFIGCTAIEGYIDTAEQFAGICVHGTGDWKDDDFLLVCLCVDNDATRRMVYDGVKDTSLNFVVIDMANETYTGDVIICGRFGGDTVFPWPPEMYPNLINPGDRPPQAYCQEKAPDTPQIVTANMMAACVGAEYLRRVLSATDDSTLPYKVAFDLREFKAYGLKE